MYSRSLVLYRAMLAGAFGLFAVSCLVISSSISFCVSSS